jgi:Fic family protein
MGFETKFTSNNILTVLRDAPDGLMLKGIEVAAGMSEMTVRKYLQPLLDSGQAEKIKIGGSEKKPLYIYKYVLCHKA